MKYREGSDPEGWDFDTTTVAGQNFLALRQAHILAGTDFYGLNNEEIGFYFITHDLMTNEQFSATFGHPPDLTP
jgi:hypothetical protein